MTEDVGDYDLKAKDLRQRFAIWSRKTLNDDHQSVLHLATKICKDENGDGFIGDKAWLRIVSGADRYDQIIRDWATELADAIGDMHGITGRRWMKSYDGAWGHQAALDGFSLAIDGRVLWSVNYRSRTLVCDRRAYAFCRNFVAGAIMAQSATFENALEYSLRVHRL